MGMPQPPLNSAIENLAGVSVKIKAVWQSWFQLVQRYLNGLTDSGPTSGRPTQDLWVGQPYFDTTLNAQVVWNGSAWVTNGSGGTVTAVTGTAPISSSGGTAPDISITEANASTDGYLSATDWNTFNNKQPAGSYVTSVGATAPISSTGGTTPVISLSNVKPTYNNQTNSSGTVARPITDMLGDFLTVLDFGADPTGANAATTTAAFQNAINTGKHIYVPTGTYAISSALTISTPGQIISGDGKLVSVLIAQVGFTGSGVLVYSGAFDEGPQIRDIKITCIQPNTSSRASLNSYPPAIYFVNTPRFVIENCQITLFNTGINMTSNSGGAFINLLEMSCFDLGIEIDGSIDSVRINYLQYWPFDMLGTNLSTIFFDANNVGVLCGRCDDLVLTNSLFINGGWHLNFQQTASGGAFGKVTNTSFDTWGSVSINGNFTLLFSGCYWTWGSILNGYQHSIQNINGTLSVVDSWFLEPSSAAFGGTADIYIGGTAKFIFDSNEFLRADLSNANRMIYVDNTAVANISNNSFLPADRVYTLPCVEAASTATLIANGNYFRTTATTNPGVAFRINGDNNNVISGNSFANWSIVFGTISKSVIWPNSFNNVFYNDTGSALTTPSRSLDTIYTNTAPHPLYVSVCLAAGSGTGVVGGWLYVNNGSGYVQVAGCGFPIGSGTTVAGFVPPGQTYYVTTFGTGVLLSAWSEC